MNPSKSDHNHLDHCWMSLIPAVDIFRLGTDTYSEHLSEVLSTKIKNSIFIFLFTYNSNTTSSHRVKRQNFEYLI